MTDTPVRTDTAITPGTGGVVITPARDDNPITVEQGRRRIRFHQITDHELDMVSTPSGSVNFGLLGMSIGVLATTVTTLLTVTLTDWRTFGGFLGATIAVVLGMIFFGAQTIKEIRQSRATIKKIRDGSS